MSTMNRPQRKSTPTPKGALRASLATVAGKLSEIFGAGNVMCRSEFHLQVLHAGRKHDVWVREDDSVRYRANGNRTNTEFARSIADIAHAFESAGKRKAVVQQVREALDIATLANWAIKHLPEDVPELIFCDAGVRGTAAIASAVWVHRCEDGVDSVARSLTLRNVTTHEAEYRAVCIGAWFTTHIAGVDCPILSDSLIAVRRCHREGEYQVQWLGREDNKLADSLANLRGS